MQIIGTMRLDRAVENFFAETEQVAFCTQNVVPGIDFTDDPLLLKRWAMRGVGLACIGFYVWLTGFFLVKRWFGTWNEWWHAAWESSGVIDPQPGTTPETLTSPSPTRTPRVLPP